MDLKITELKNISSLIEQKYNVDVKLFAPFAYKRSIERLIEKTAVQDVNILMNKITNGAINEDIFYNYIEVPETGMFRDGSTWRKIKQILISDIASANKKYKIWIPSASTGDEYFTLLILLYQENLIDKVEITLSSWSNKTLTILQEANYTLKRLETHNSNYKRFEGKKDFDKYYKITGTQVSFKHLIKNTYFKKINLLNVNDQGRYNLIIYRNKLIYLSSQGQELILNKIKENLSVSGKIVFGLGENIYSTQEAKNNFIPVYEQEHIYKRKI